LSDWLHFNFNSVNWLNQVIIKQQIKM